ncbi:MAG: DNA polymerase I, partial [Dehalococcoidia bacterium]
MPATPKPTRLVILDSHGILYRAFFALGQSDNPLRTSKGEVSFAVYGYAESLLLVLERLKPTHILAAWDSAGKTFRHEASEDYKATRRETPSDLIPQMVRVREMLDAFNIPVFEIPGFEADDVVGTLAKQAADQGIETYIATLDTDMVQLVRPNVKLFMYRPYQRDVVEYDEARAAERWGFSPPYMVDFKALRGDTSDNIPGIRGIGDKTATDLIRQFGSIESIYEHLDEVQKPSVKAKLIEGEETARFSKKLATIVTDIPIELDLEACRVQGFERERLLSFFRELEFRTLAARLPGILGFEDMPPATPPAEEIPTAYTVVADEDGLLSLAAAMRDAGSFSIATMTISGDTSSRLLLGLAIATAPGTAWYIPVGHAPRLDGSVSQPGLERIRQTIGPLLSDPAIPRLAYGSKYVRHDLAEAGIDFATCEFDVSIAAFLLGDTTSNLYALVSERLGIEMVTLPQLTGGGRNATPLPQVDLERVADYACQQADFALRMRALLEGPLKERGQWDLFAEMELPLVEVLWRMERCGIAIDTSVLRDIAQGMAGDIDRLEREIYATVGHEFNIGSPKQLSDILFGELQLPKTRKTTQGYSTDQRALESLRSVAPIIDLIFQYRELTKLKSTYLDALPGSVGPDGRIHTDFQQTVAATGRLSSTNPNLQNIPVRTDTGRDIRRAFVATGFDEPLFVAADYSQIELRILAHITGDKGLIDAFLADQDIHRATASTVYGVPPDAVTRQMRDTAKMVN